MRVLLWHGWVLEGSGSNVYTARVAEVLRRKGHDVLVVCQEPHPERFGFVDAWASAGPRGVSRLTLTGVAGAAGRCVVLRSEIGSILPVFVYDDYEGFEVKRFVDLSDADLAAYLDRNVDALRAAVGWHGSEVVVAGHAVPGPVVAGRALGPGRYIAKVHGSDLEYAVNMQGRYLTLAREGLEGAVAVTGASSDVLARTVAAVPAVADRLRLVPPGVDVHAFRPMRRSEALLDAASRLDGNPQAREGRPTSADSLALEAAGSHDREGLDRIARSYDQTAPDREAATGIRGLAPTRGPLVGYFGKLIPQKGVDRFLSALALTRPTVRGLVVGFGLFREWLTALAIALDRGADDLVAWLEASSRIRTDLSVRDIRRARGFGARVTFTGRLDHGYAPHVLAALDVLVVPSVLPEAFGMVAAEGAAAGALPLVARHSGLEEVAGALEGEVGRPGLFSFEPGEGSSRRIAASLRALLAVPASERRELSGAVAGFVRREWTWDRTVERLLGAATMQRPRGSPQAASPDGPR